MPHETNKHKTSLITISGIVQGVGFRPFVWQLANDMGLKGEVLNNGQGVQIILNFCEDEQEQFLKRLEAEIPPLAKITKIKTSAALKFRPFQSFTIRPSEQSEMQTQISPDAATCKACIKEITSPTEHRYNYPFTNCTHCGPRLSIIYEAPYDRSATSMAPFKMCDQCQKEYEDPSDRRFHAQPIACPNCGPVLELKWLSETTEQSIDINQEDAIKNAAELIKAGFIGAIKGLGGFHLCCLARDGDLVETLRKRKKRSNKAFALMCKDSAQAKEIGLFSEEALTQLESTTAPIVLVKKRFAKEGSDRLPEAIAPGLHEIGIMLPNTPLHHLLLAEFDEPLIMTSGNLSNMPQLITNEEVQKELSEVADFALLHNRLITNRVDDSVVRASAKQTTILRRARGYAPAPIPLPKGFEEAPDLIACGAELKSTFCMLKNGEAILSQHLGDLEHVPTFEAYQQTIALYTDLFEFQPEFRVIDEHPEYLSSKLGEGQSEKDQIPLIKTQHHHAHMASALGENNHGLNDGNCLGLILDGIGFGEDGTIWGGELLYGDYTEFKRIGALEGVPLLGGSAAVKEPWRNLYSHCEQTLGWQEIEHHYNDLSLMKHMREKPLSTLNAMMKKGINSPMSSSCGRLFDAVAASLELSIDEVTYEGEAAMQLEALVSQAIYDEIPKEELYKAKIKHERQINKVNFSLLWKALFEDLDQEKSKSYIATKFHKSLTYILLDWIKGAVHTLNIDVKPDGLDNKLKIALSGGCFQNNTLLENLALLLEKNGFIPIIQSELPANDGGISYGQALIAAAKHLKS